MNSQTSSSRQESSQNPLDCGKSKSPTGGYALLWRTAVRSSISRRLVILAGFAMIFASVASQMEIFALGVLTRKAPSFFQLFGPINADGALTTATKVTREQVEERWQEIDLTNSGEIDEKSVLAFVDSVGSEDFLTNAVRALGRWVDVDAALWKMACFVLAVALFKAITLFGYRYATRLAAIQISADLRRHYFSHIQMLSMAFYQRHHTASITARVTGDSAMVAEAVNSSLVNYLQTPFMVVTTLVLCFCASWKLSLIIFAGLPLIAFPIATLARHVKRISKQIQQKQERFTGELIDFITGIGTVKAFGMEEYLLGRFFKQNQLLMRLEAKNARYDLATRPIVHTLAMMFLAAALLYGIYGLQMEVAEIFFFCGLLYLFYEPIKKFAEENSHIQRGIAAAERMGELMQTVEAVEQRNQGAPFTTLQKELSFHQVWFRYEASAPWVLRNLSFSIRAGEAVAFVGATGAGKSTVAQLLLRFYEATEGEIAFDGTPVAEYSMESLREKIGWVAQRPFLFLDTVAANIACSSNYSLERVQAAAVRAHAAEFIEKLPQGYETILAEGGKNLSGGQQQRLTIARALYREAPILLLDEATSALDAVSEQQIKSVIHSLKGEVTQIIIAHRLSVVEAVDRIFYFDEGQIIAQGTLEELLSSSEPFRRLWKAGSHSHHAES